MMKPRLLCLQPCPGGPPPESYTPSCCPPPTPLCLSPLPSGRSGGCNKTPRLGSLQTTVLGAGGARPGCQGPGWAPSRLRGSHCAPSWREGQGGLWGLFSKGTNPTVRALPWGVCFSM